MPDRQFERERVRAPDQHQSHYVPATTKREREWNIRKHPTHYLSLKDATKCRQHWMKMAIVKTNGSERKRPSMVLVLNARNEAKTSYETIYPSELCCFFNPFFSLSRLLLVRYCFAGNVIVSFFRFSMENVRKKMVLFSKRDFCLKTQYFGFHFRGIQVLRIKWTNVTFC